MRLRGEGGSNFPGERNLGEGIIYFTPTLTKNNLYCFKFHLPYQIKIANPLLSALYCVSK